jgi:hypothetical protein
VVDRRRAEVLHRLRKKATMMRAREEAEEPERRGEELRKVREAAEHVNYCRDRIVFDIDEDGNVFSAHDGKPITTVHQTLADEWFFDFVADGHNPRGLLLDWETEAFYLPDPPYEMVFSRDRCNLACFFWAIGDDRAYPWNLFGPERLDPERAAELEPWGHGGGRG